MVAVLSLPCICDQSITLVVPVPQSKAEIDLPMTDFPSVLT